MADFDAEITDDLGRNVLASVAGTNSNPWRSSKHVVSLMFQLTETFSNASVAFGFPVR